MLCSISLIYLSEKGKLIISYFIRKRETKFAGSIKMISFKYMDDTKRHMRIKKFQKILRKENIDAAIISTLAGDDIHLRYLLRRDIGNSFLIIPKKGNSTLVVPKMELAEARNYLQSVKIMEYRQPLRKQFELLLKDKTIIGINHDSITLNGFKTIKKLLKKRKFKDISHILKNMRLCKDEEELQYIRKACRIGDKILSGIKENFKAFRTEEDIRKYIISSCASNMCSPAFEPLVASGKNSGYVHYKGDKKKIGKGFMFIDFGVDYKGYKSDMTRTFYIGKPGPKQRAEYKNLLNIQKQACSMAISGTKVSDIDDYVKKSLGNLSEYYTHALGHGVGLDIHEAPAVSSGSDDIIEKGMVLTIEPGYYLPGQYGMRIEDTIYVTGKGNRILTRSSKELFEVRQ